ncbi:CBS domain-containing protein [Methylocystis heyeri]|uniref:CBS domain-containing protein n=1 Tax=Methylocystis heyeri TaxID=391905 RepID=A0A6B8KBG4_9HYPH|nr:CBS domain-containing protein [Methylocystis heyeri]QGM44892.1 CBS domain-containing protein [Methylocystis heyeri]
MSVGRILAMKGVDVYTATPDQTLQDVAAELVEKGIGALVVLNPSGEVVGLIGERDIVSAVARHGAAALQQEVACHMQTNCRMANEHDSIDEASDTMTEERCRHLPVLSNGRLAGIVSIGDVVKYRIETIEAERLALRHYIATA